MATAERALLHRGGRPGTWGSLGLWADGEEDYAEACAALASRVGQAAVIAPGDRVLSVACGAGDELRLWAQRFGATRVTGVEIDGALAVAARRAASGCGATVDVHAGSGRELHRLGLLPGGFDRVLCVDGAYHLSPREAFLQGAADLLRPGGRLAYTDLCLEPRRGAWAGGALRGAARLCGLSAAELMPVAAQVSRLQALGFEDVRAERLDEAVLGGFARYVRQQGRRIARTWVHRDWRRPGITARLIGPCRAAGLGYVLLSATRANASPAAGSTRDPIGSG